MKVSLTIETTLIKEVEVEANSIEEAIERFYDKAEDYDLTDTEDLDTRVIHARIAII